MDKLSNKVLKYLKKQTSPTPQAVITDKYGENAKRSLNYLEKDGFIRLGTIFGDRFIEYDKLPNALKANQSLVYEITSLGINYLEEKPGQDFDRWLTRIAAIIGAITGCVSLVLEIMLHFL